MDPKLKAFLDLIAWSEGTSTSTVTLNQGYDVLVTGIHGPGAFTDYSDHPFAHGGSVQWHANPAEFSTAAGRYQILAHYFEVYKAQLGLPDFAPASQDAVAVQLMKERGALAMVMAGNIAGAIRACSSAWASFPGNDYAQGGHDMATLLEEYQVLLG